MTTPTDIRKLLDRKEAKLTAIVALDKGIDATKKRLNDQVEEQRKAYDALLAEGFTPEELKSIGIARRRRPQNTAPIRNGRTPRNSPPATAPAEANNEATPHAEAKNWPKNAPQPPTPTFYDGHNDLYHHEDKGS